MGKPGAHITIFSPSFLPFPRTFEGFAPSRGEEANRWHCAVSGGAQPCWRPDTGCPNAGKALHFREVSPHAKAEAKSPCGPSSILSCCCFGPKHDAKRMCLYTTSGHHLLTGKGMQNHPANQVSVRKAHIPIENIFLPASFVAGAGRLDALGAVPVPG